MIIQRDTEVTIPKQDGKVTRIQNSIKAYFADDLYYSFDGNQWFWFAPHETVLTVDDITLLYKGNRTEIDIPVSYTSPIIQGGQMGSSTFTGLQDTPDSYQGQAGKVIKVKDSEDGVEFADIQSSYKFMGDKIPSVDIQAEIGDRYLQTSNGRVWICWGVDCNGKSGWFSKDKKGNWTYDLEYATLSASIPYDLFFSFVESLWDDDDGSYYFHSQYNTDEIDVKEWILGRKAPILNVSNDTSTPKYKTDINGGDYDITTQNFGFSAILFNSGYFNNSNVVLFKIVSDGDYNTQKNRKYINVIKQSDGVWKVRFSNTDNSKSREYSLGVIDDSVALTCLFDGSNVKVYRNGALEYNETHDFEDIPNPSQPSVFFSPKYVLIEDLLLHLTSLPNDTEIQDYYNKEYVR